MLTNRVLVLAFALIVAGGSAAGAADKPVLVRGSIVSLSPSAFTVKTATGLFTIAYGPKTAFVGADRGSPSDIVPGVFVGIANMPGAGASRALEVSVFDEKMRGVGEGDRPWEAPALHGSRMTNGTVAQPRAMMTNGTVGATNGAAKTITVNYKGGSRKIAVNPGTPVVRIAPGNAKLLARNASVFVSAQKLPSGLTARFAVIGKNGTAVPL
ncbi:MAG: hypothetical protein JWM87_4852 [Candidatus Eremiobacteraeota bacterium]|nr:hypothetical protein [Candidatus Eremiobacteraeota bacterium]